MDDERTRRSGKTRAGWSTLAPATRSLVPIDAAEVRAALTREHIVEHFRVEVRGPEDGWWRGRECPACRKRWGNLAGSGFGIGRRGWMCKACGAKGDLLDLLARLADRDIRREFPIVLDLGAQLAGVRNADADPAKRAQRRAELAQVERARNTKAAAAAQQRRHEARQTAPSIWNSQIRDHLRGRRYLEGRGLDVDVLIGRGLVRFCPVGWRPADAAGDPTVALHDWDGGVLSVVRRRMGDDEPKTPGLTGHPTDGTLVGHLGQITNSVDVIVTEGVVDALTAAVAWPHAVVLGAHGASHFAKVCAAATSRVQAAGGRLLLVPDADPPGHAVAVEGGKRAMEDGLDLDVDLILIEPDGYADLNAAWCAGWRP